MDDNKTLASPTTFTRVALPTSAGSSYNRCNVPSSVLGGLTFQQHPIPLLIDGVASLHARFFERLETLTDIDERQRLFLTHMRASFQLEHPEEVGYDAASLHPGRFKIDYLRLLRGWLFDSNGREGAVLKGWVESRFGLRPRAHRGALHDRDGETFAAYAVERAVGLQNTNALEAQLDVLYSYCQFELALGATQQHMRLFRGVHRLDEYEILADAGTASPAMLLNNLNSFTRIAERAGEFGDQVFSAQIPLSKILYYSGLLPGCLQGEEEYLVLGGVYRIQRLHL